MDVSFANQALSAVYVAQHADRLEPGVYDVPEDIDKEVARLTLASMGVRIDELTGEQRRYLARWDAGT
jgi:adenosylhomocysteinase